MRLLCLTAFIVFSACHNNNSNNDVNTKPHDTKASSRADTMGLHTKYKDLLKKASNLVDTNVFDKIRARCDHQIIPWLENALDALQNDVPYNAQGAHSGMSAYKEAPKTPREMIGFAIDKDKYCSIPHYIERVEQTLDPKSKDYNSALQDQDGDLREFIENMKTMLAELKNYHF